MARKTKDVYSRINEKLSKIDALQKQLTIENNELNELYKEKDDLEMRMIFDAVKERNLSAEEVIKLIQK